MILYWNTRKKGTGSGSCDYPLESSVVRNVVYANGTKTGTYSSAPAIAGGFKDGEELVDDIFAILFAQLNDQIAAVETSKIALGKGVTPTLAEIPSDAWYRQSWTNKILNRTPGIFYGIEDVNTQDGGGGSAQTYKVFIEVVAVDNGQSNDVDRRIERYAQAIKKVMERNHRTLSYCSQIKIATVVPFSFKLELDSNDEIKVGGVSVLATIT